MFVQCLCYLVESKCFISCGFLLKLLVPVAFEVDGIDQHQPSQIVQHTLSQQILNFTCEFEAEISNDQLHYYIIYAHIYLCVCRHREFCISVTIYSTQPF